MHAVRIWSIVVFLHIFDIGPRTEDLIAFAANDNNLYAGVVINVGKCCFELTCHWDGEAIEVFGTVEPNGGYLFFLLYNYFGVWGRLCCNCWGKEAESVHVSVYIRIIKKLSSHQDSYGRGTSFRLIMKFAGFSGCLRKPGAFSISDIVEL